MLIIDQSSFTVVEYTLFFVFLARPTTVHWKVETLCSKETHRVFTVKNFLQKWICLFVGGVGWAATQLASNIVNNVKIYGTSSASKHDDIVNNGVTLPLTYENYISEIKKPEIDIIIDNIGGKNVKDSLALLRPFGRVVLTGKICCVY